MGGCAGACRDSLAKIQLLTFAFIRYAVGPEVRLSEVGGSIKPLPPVRSGRVEAAHDPFPDISSAKAA